MGNLNKPNIRFPEFDGDWGEKKLGELGVFYGGGTPDTNILKYWNGDIPWISSSDITEDSIQEFHVTRFITDEAIKKSATKIIPANSILIVSRVGIGKFAVSKIPICTSQDFTNLTLKNDNPYFLTYYFKLNAKLFLRFSQGTSIKGFTGSDIRNILLLIPTLPEQQKIASFFTAIDNKISQLKRKKTLLEKYKKGVMQKIFSQEIRFKDDNGQEFPKWEKKKLGEVYNITSSKRVFQDEWTKSGVPFYRAREIVKLSESGYVDNELFISNEMYDEYKSKYGVPQKNDLLVTGVGTIGVLYVVRENEKFYFKDGNIIWFKSSGSINSQYVKHLFRIRIIRKQIEDNASITTVGTYTIESANKTVVPFPNIREQTKIANFLSAIDDKINHTKKQIEKAEVWKKGLMKQMFV